MSEEPTASTEVSKAALTSPPDALCAPASYGGHDYWLCPTLRTWSSARAQCQTIGYDLATIETTGENQFLLSKLLVNAWIGANDQTTEGTWRWAQTNNQFWQGTASGSAVGGAYRNWGLFEPNNFLNQDCAMFRGGLGLGTWSDENCGLLANFVCEGDLCPNDPNKSEPGQCGCGVADTDSDGDGTADCVDGCVNDPGKTAPGDCGCGMSDADSDNDGVTCDDQCPNDQTKTAPGDCGCADSPQPSGAACSDGLCVENTQCNGAGSCGTASECGAPDSDCEYRMRGGTSYWFCDNDRTFADAEARCQSKGMELVTIESAGEDAFITQHANEHSFLGGSDQTTEGTWEWLGTGAQFWSGGPSGNAVGGAYTNFAWGEPSNLLSGNDCMVKSLLSGGQWKSHPCSFQDAFVCEVRRECLSDADCPDGGLCDTDSQCVPPVILEDAPIHLEAFWSKDPDTGEEHADDGEGTAPEVTQFQIPERLRVLLGNAANATAELSFGLGNLDVTCVYRGGSGVASPTTDLEMAQGRFYRFESCTNGLVPGDSATATGWRLHLTGGDIGQSRTSVSTYLGPGCQPSMDPPMWPEDIRQIRESFRWRDTVAVPEVDPDGHPALRYAMIYVESDEQYDALKRSPLLASPLPFFDSELARYKDQCGSPDYSGDGYGIFLHTYLPASIYNHWRTLAVDALNAGVGQIPFRTVILKSIPDPTFANADGTISWQALKDAGVFPFRKSTATQQPFVHRSIARVLRPIVNVVVDVVEQVAEVVVFVNPDDILETFASIAEDIRDVAQGFIGDLDELLNGSVTLTIDVTVLNRDPGFDTTGPMQRAWGRTRGSALVPSGSELRIIQSAGLHADDINGAGVASITVVKGRLPSSLCWGLENDSVIVSNFLTEDEFCLGSNELLNAFVARTAGGGGGVLTRDRRMPLRVSNAKVNVMTQMSDAASYMRTVAGYTPNQVEVAVGSAMAETVGIISEGRSVALCLDFAEAKLIATTLLAGIGAAYGAVIPGGGSVAGAVAAVGGSPMLMKDVFIVDEEAKRSRAVATHEYGHFVMCNFFHDHSVTALPGLLIDSVRNLPSDSRDDDLGVSMESFADLIAQQVAGGTNYVAPVAPDAIRRTSASYCAGPTGPLRCLESNFRGVSDAPGDEFHDEVSRLVTTLYDAFDRPSDAWRTSSIPTNADAWAASGVPATLTPRSTGYLQSIDENIALTGAGLRSFGRKLAAERGDEGDALRAIAEVMSDQGNTWCDICGLFALHDPGFNASVSTRQQIWAACTVGALAGLVGAPPDPTLRLRASDCRPCAADEISDPSGTCINCPGAREVVVGNTCVECPSGTRAVGGLCVPCPTGQVSTTDNQCVPCESFWERPNSAGDACVECAEDTFINWNFLTPLRCRGDLFTDVTSTVTPGDECPDDYYFSMGPLSTLGDALRDRNPLDELRVDASHMLPASEGMTVAECQDQSGILRGELYTVFEQTFSEVVTPVSVIGHGVCHSEPLSNPDFCAEPCYLVFPILTLTPEQLRPVSEGGEGIFVASFRPDPSPDLRPLDVFVSTGYYPNCEL